MQQPDEFLTLRGASERYFNRTVSLEAIRDWVNAGRLPYVRPGRTILVRRSDLDALVSKSAGARYPAPWLRGKKKKSETASVA